MLYKSAKLLDDAQFQSAFEKQSAYPYGYHTAFPPSRLANEGFAAGPCVALPGGCKQQYVNSIAVDHYNEKILSGRPGDTRSPSNSTELFGGAFKARGDGALTNPDSLTQAWTPVGGQLPHCNRRLSEMTYDTWACQGSKPQSEEAFGKRGGVSTRVGLEYISKC